MRRRRQEDVAMAMAITLSLLGAVEMLSEQQRL